MNHFPAIRDSKPIPCIYHPLLCTLLNKIYNKEVLLEDDEHYRVYRALKNFVKNLRRVMTELYEMGDLIMSEEHSSLGWNGMYKNKQTRSSDAFAIKAILHCLIKAVSPRHIAIYKKYGLIANNNNTRRQLEIYPLIIRDVRRLVLGIDVGLYSQLENRLFAFMLHKRNPEHPLLGRQIIYY